MDSWLQRVWYGRSVWAWILWPLSLLFALVSGLRRAAFRIGLLSRVRVARPVIVVGNISVGGTGKTPLVIWLAEQLAQRGFRPGVITRGYGGLSSSWPVDVTTSSDPAQVGDEAVLIAQRSNALVVAGPDRATAAEQAIARGADVILSDDGLQHYRLIRDFEIAVVDAARMFGNGLLLPAGPLREGTGRLRKVDAVAYTIRGTSALERVSTDPKRYVVTSHLSVARHLVTGEQRQLESFRGQQVHAVAGIGNPAAFFAGLRAFGLGVQSRALPDHVALASHHVQFGDALPVFMTEKDAVKCAAFADNRHWVVPLQTGIEGSDRLLQQIEAAIRRH